MCYDPYRSVVAGGGTIFSRAWLSDRPTGVVSAPKPTVTEVGDRPSSIGPDRPGDSADFGNPFTGETYAPEPDDTGDAD